jgi:quercetin dioxygenase-like cupin family protein
MRRPRGGSRTCNVSVRLTIPRDFARSAEVTHPHAQASYVAKGRFEVTIGGKSTIIGKGGSFIVPSGARHGVKALGKGRLVDTFTPHRADFLDG